MQNVTGTNYFFDRGRDRMNALSRTAEALQEQIATGKKLTVASQDSAAWQRLQGLVRAKADNTAYAANIEFARSVLAQADSALGAVQTRLQRAAELTIQAKSGTMSASDRAVIAGELEAIVGDLTQLAQTRDARGQPLFDAAAAAIPVADGIAVIANEDPARVFGSILGDLSAFATTLRTGTSAAAGTAAASALTAVNAGIANAASIQGAVGARAARVELVAGAATDAAAVTEQQRMAIEDTDLTTAIADLQKAMTVLEATQASFSKLTELSLFNYLR